MDTQEPKVLDVLGEKVPEEKLKAALRDVLKVRGLSGDLILQKSVSAEELEKVRGGGCQYANVYKYAFF